MKRDLYLWLGFVMLSFLAVIVDVDYICYSCELFGTLSLSGVDAREDFDSLHEKKPENCP